MTEWLEDYHHREYIDCPRCGGTGTVSHYEPHWRDDTVEVEVEERCSQCQGHGRLYRKDIDKR
jgi:DnaJ-class molecular chaperone